MKILTLKKIITITGILIFLPSCTSQKLQEVGNASKKEPYLQNNPENKLRVEENDPWEGVRFVEDESKKIEIDETLEEKVRIQLGWQVEDTDEIENDVHKLPDGTLLMAGRSKRYLSIPWIIHLTASGVTINNFSSKRNYQKIPLTIIGFVDGFAYFKADFSEGSGRTTETFAIQITNGDLISLDKKDIEYEINETKRTTNPDFCRIHHCVEGVALN